MKTSLLLVLCLVAVCSGCDEYLQSVHEARTKETQVSAEWLIGDWKLTSSTATFEKGMGHSLSAISRDENGKVRMKREVAILKIGDDEFIELKGPPYEIDNNGTLNGKKLEHVYSVFRITRKKDEFTLWRFENRKYVRGISRTPIIRPDVLSDDSAATGGTAEIEAFYQENGRYMTKETVTLNRIVK